MTAQHTPRKWKKQGYRIFANAFAKPEYPIHAEKRGLIAKAFKEADAYLIAAAPDLLAALKVLTNYVDERTGDNECRPLENAIAAIAKAERKP